MKIEQFLRAGIVCAAFLFVVIIVIYGNAQWTIDNGTDVTAPNSIKQINNSFSSISVLRSRYENNTLLRYTRAGQSEQDDPTTEDTNFFEYQARSFEATGEALASSGGWFATITAVGNYLMVPPVIFTTGIVLIIIGIAFALITFWRGRKP